jgi:hypothetical protein
VNTVIRGTNADLIANVAALYLREGAQVADVTYGKGVFWRKCQDRSVTLFASDLRPPPPGAAQLDFWHPLRLYRLHADFRQLPYPSACMDVVVLDPPYIHNPGQHLTDRRYNNAATTGGLYHRDIVATLYLPGILEAARILKPGRQLWVKCKDEIESATQQWAHREMYDLAMGFQYFTALDYAILHTAPPHGQRWERQLHLRKNHSLLWLFTRTSQPLRTVRPNGRPRKDATNFDTNIKVLTQGGTSREYLLARLARDYPHIFVRFQAGEFRSVHAAAQAAGLVKPRRSATGAAMGAAAD